MDMVGLEYVDKKSYSFIWSFVRSELKNLKPLGLPISPHLRCQMPSRIGIYSGKALPCICGKRGNHSV